MIDGFKIVYGSDKSAAEEVKRIFNILPKSYQLNSTTTKFDYKLILKEAIHYLEYQITNERLKAAFILFDLDGNGTISFEEI